MWNKILAVLTTIGAAFSAIFFVLFKEAREQRKAEEEKNENLNTNLAALEAADNAEKELKEVHAKLKEKAHSGNTLDSFNACNELLSE